MEFLFNCMKFAKKVKFILQIQKKVASLHPQSKNGGIAQLARAPALQAGGRRFDSDYLHQKPLRSNSERFFLYVCRPLLVSDNSLWVC